jgi:cyclic-di-GMP-binding biofilm dispersal mediator protein
MDRKTAVIIGGTGAFGRRFAKQMSESHTVVLLVRDRNRVPAELTGMLTLEIDITRRETLEAAMAEVLRVHGGIDAVINAAGVVAFGEVSEATSRMLLEVNTLGVLNVIAVARAGLNAGGWLLSLSGVAAEMQIVGMGSYCASKAGASAAMRTAARELRRAGVRAIDVRVGHCETGLVDRSLEGRAGAMPKGFDPDAVVERILQLVEAGVVDIGPESFENLPRSL